jgi:hypothetical protein
MTNQSDLQQKAQTCRYCGHAADAHTLAQTLAATVEVCLACRDLGGRAASLHEYAPGEYDVEFNALRSLRDSTPPVEAEVRPLTMSDAAALMTRALRWIVHSPGCDSEYGWSACKCGARALRLDIERGIRRANEAQAEIATLQQKLAAAEAERDARGQALADAANEIACSGTLVHRIRTLRKEHAATVATLIAERDALQSQLRTVRSWVVCSQACNYREKCGCGAAATLAEIDAMLPSGFARGTPEQIEHDRAKMEKSSKGSGA